MEIKRHLLFIFLALFLSSCSKDQDFSKLENIYTLYKNQNNNPEVKFFEKEMFNDFDYKIIEIKTTGVVVQVLMLPITQRNGIFNYTSGQGQSITIDGDYITKTNGFDIDLVSLENFKKNVDSDISYSYKSKKIYKFLTPTFTLNDMMFLCERKLLKNETLNILGDLKKVSLISEKCSNENVNFENFFWYDKRGYLWKSKQVFPKNGILAEITVLKQ